MNDLRKAAEMAFTELCNQRDAHYTKDIPTELTQAIHALRQSLDDKPPVKTYAGGRPNYCTPEETPEVTGEVTRDVDAVNISQERVDETAKSEHDLWIAAACLKSTVEAAIKAGDWKVDGACDPTMDLQYLANCFSSIQNREWVDYTDEQLMEEVRRRGFVIRDAQIGREWVGLTDDEIDTLANEHLVNVQEYIGMGEYISSIDGEVEFARAIEAKLKEKNGG